jgi:hypothetical protein
VKKEGEEVDKEGSERGEKEIGGDTEISGIRKKKKRTQQKHNFYFQPLRRSDVIK